MLNSKKTIIFQDSGWGGEFRESSDIFVPLLILNVGEGRVQWLF